MNRCVCTGVFYNWYFWFAKMLLKNTQNWVEKSGNWLAWRDIHILVEKNVSSQIALLLNSINYLDYPGKTSKWASDSPSRQVAQPTTDEGLKMILEEISVSLQPAEVWKCVIHIRDRARDYIIFLNGDCLDSQRNQLRKVQMNGDFT